MNIDPELATHVTVVSGPTAVGKGTVVAAVRARHPQVWVSVSATTRRPRRGEIDGVHYLFVTDSEFEAMIDEGQLLEWAIVHGSARYGTPRRPVEVALRGGREVILEIEIQGARQVRHTWPEARFVFIEPPSWDELVHRLVGRGTETATQQQRRLETARTELAAAAEFDHVIVNDDLQRAVGELVGLMGLSQPGTDSDAGRATTKEG